MSRLRLHRLAAALLLVLAGIAPATATDFLSGVEDLPLAPGLREVTHAGMVFDTPGGRIVEAYAVGSGNADDFLGFYRRTLPQLGWRRLDGDRYAREGERLVIEVSRRDAALTVQFRITPE